MKKLLPLVALTVLLAACSGTSPDGGIAPQLTQCLQEKKIVMFGASWCPHCAEQKKLFGRSAKQMPYFECAQGQGQAPECADRGIVSYPTWQFDPATLQALPEEVMISLLNGEITKSRGSVELVRQSLASSDESLRAGLALIEKDRDALIASDDTAFQKLQKLTFVSLSADKKTLEERPAYVAGRITGKRTLEELSLYTGCALQ